MGISNSSVRTTERRSNVLHLWLTSRGSLVLLAARGDAHQPLKSLYFLFRKSDSSLTTTTTLVIVDRNLSTADLEFTRIRLTQPFIERQHRNPQSLGGIGGRQKCGRA